MAVLKGAKQRCRSEVSGQSGSRVWGKMVLTRRAWSGTGVDTLPGVVQDDDYLIKSHTSFFAASANLLMLPAVKLLSAKENLGLTKTCLLVPCKEANGQASWETWLS